MAIPSDYGPYCDECGNYYSSCTCCKWCQASLERGCDCIDRRDCSEAGQPGHLWCGKCPHDVTKKTPKFACSECAYEYERALRKKENERIDEIYKELSEEVPF